MGRIAQIVLVNEERCNGCRRCQLVCSFKHYKVANPARSRIKVLRLEPGIDMPIVCGHCVRPPCLESCPQKVITKDPNTGLVLVDSTKCIGCGSCIGACPRGAVSLDPETGIAMMCDLCGSSPACVKNCPTNALRIGSPNLLAQKSQVEWVKLMENVREFGS